MPETTTPKNFLTSTNSLTKSISIISSGFSYLLVIKEFLKSFCGLVPSLEYIANTLSFRLDCILNSSNKKYDFITGMVSPIDQVIPTTVPGIAYLVEGAQAPSRRGPMKRVYSKLYSFIVLIWCASALVKSSFCGQHSTRGNLVLRNEINGIFRELGGYEKLLSRKTPGTNYVSLSHVSAFILPGIIYESELKKIMLQVIKKHPMLRSYIFEESSDKFYWREINGSLESIIDSTVKVIKVSSMSDFTRKWQDMYNLGLNKAQFADDGAQWQLCNIIYNNKGSPMSAIVFIFNHGLDDQTSINIVMKDILAYYSNPNLVSNMKEFPLSIEEAVGPYKKFNIKTILWSLYQLCNSLRMPIMVPYRIKKLKTINPSEYKYISNPDNRRTFSTFFSLSKLQTNETLKFCRQNNITFTNLLCALILIITSANIQENASDYDDINLRFLLSVGLRQYSEASKRDFTDETVACASGAIDYVITVPKMATISGTMKDDNFSTSSLFLEQVIKLSEACKAAGNKIIKDSQFVPESVRLFGIGMKVADILRVVELEAKNPESMGRGYSCGVSSMGICSMDDRKTLKLAPSQGYYATSHARNGVLILLSCMTIDGSFCGCIQFTDPLINKNEAEEINTKIVKYIQKIIED